DQPESEGGDASGGDEPSGSPKGPRNPWLPSGEEPPRRSASIEDIFRNRDPGRRGGGGGGGGSGFPKLPRRADGRSWVPAIAGAILLAWLFMTSYHQIGPKEQGIVTFFGKYSRTLLPGGSFTLPWPLQSVDVEDVTSIRRDSIPDSDTEKLMLTGDQSLVDLSYLVRWNIKNLKLYKFRLEDPESTVKEVAEAAMRASVAEVSLNDVMNGTGRAQIEQNVRQRMQAILDAYQSGVVIQGVDIKKTDPPEKVVAAFQEVSAAQQDAQRDISNAQAVAQQLLAQAQGSAASFDKVYEQYRLAPEVTRRRMYYETMERVLANNDKVIVEANGVTPYLPLPEVRRKTNEEIQVQAPSAQGGQ
ncbi:MAG: protease modulator HflK, partial [Novosphingobium sp.]